MAIKINPTGRYLVQAAVRNGQVFPMPHLYIDGRIEPFERETPETEFIPGFAVECQASASAVAFITSVQGSISEILAQMATYRFQPGTDIIIRRL